MKYYLVLPDILWVLKYHINMIIIRIVMIIINSSIITLTLVAIKTVELPSASVDVIIGRPVELVTRCIEVVLMQRMVNYQRLHIMLYNNL